MSGPNEIEVTSESAFTIGSDLVFKDVVVSFGNKTILNNVSGLVEPGKLLAVLGPSGAGKTTLLNCLAGRLPFCSGEITLNGIPITKKVKRKCCYVLQQDVFFPTLTLEDTLMFVASLRLSDKLTHEEKRRRMNEVVESLGLERCLKTMVGGDMMPGLSGGERKRANIACELLTNPSLILLDEPTTGLDSSAAYSLINTLKDYAQTNNKTIVATIHQPSTQLFYFFDSVLLLCNGQLVYFGATENVVEYFNSIDMTVPSGYNPADFIMEKMKESEEVQKQLFDSAVDLRSSRSWPKILSTNPGFRDILVSTSMLDEFSFDSKTEKKSILNRFKKHMSSDYDSDTDNYNSKWPTGFFTQYKHLTVRTFQLSRPRILDKLKILENVLICTIVSLIWFQLPRTEETLRDRMGAVFFIAAHWGFIPLFDAVTSFPLERMVINKERSAGWYRLSAYYLAKMTSELPLIFIQPLFFVVIAYWCIGLNGIAAFFATIGTVFIDSLAGQSLGLFLGIVNTEMRQAITVTVLIEMCIMLLGGLFTRTLPFWLNWTKYLSFIHYSFHCLMVLEFKSEYPVRCSVSFNNTAFAICKGNTTNTIPSEMVLEYYHVDWKYWQYLLPLVLFIVIFRTLGYIALRFFQKPR